MKSIQAAINYAYILKWQDKLLEAENLLKKLAEEPTVSTNSHALFMVLWVLGIVQFDQQKFGDAQITFIRAYNTLAAVKETLFFLLHFKKTRRYTKATTKKTFAAAHTPQFFDRFQPKANSTRNDHHEI